MRNITYVLLCKDSERGRQRDIFRGETTNCFKWWANAFLQKGENMVKFHFTDWSALENIFLQKK